MNRFRHLTARDKRAYDRNGYVKAAAMYSREEVERLLMTAEGDDVVRAYTYGRRDEGGRTTRLALWYSLDDNIYGAFARSERMVRGVERLLEGPPCHFHTKLMQKEPRVGGAWEWHQDYGYWYHDGFLYPRMMSVMVALTPSNRRNGCLQVIRGSHLIGRIEHGAAGDQKGADPEVVREALSRLERVFVELRPGDALFFHGNLLHRSDRNESDRPRWSLISAFNRLDNPPYKEQHPSCRTPIQAVPDTQILSMAPSGASESTHFRSSSS